MPEWNAQFDLSLRTNETRLVTALAGADALASVIRGVYVSPFERARLDRLNIIRTVHATTAIEGNNLVEGQVAQVIEPERPANWEKSRRKEVLEARNADRAMRFIADTLDGSPSRPLTETLICRLNEILTEGLGYRNHTPGLYRNHGVTAGIFVPPRDPHRVRELMREFISWLYEGESASWHPILRAIAAHFYLVSIHPFGDGNGRTSRAVESYLLYQSGINAFGFYSLANFYYRDRDEYILRLNSAREEFDLALFVLYAAEGLVGELRRVHGEVLGYLARLAFKDYAQSVLRREKMVSKLRDRLADFIDFLGSEPVPISEIRERSHRIGDLYRRASSRTMERDLALLERLGLIQRHDGSISPEMSSLP